ncbi:uncharacterized protein LOC107814801 [Nicotiana tabacum]|uniref:uncharacterized protein LOC107814801 n=1 Tax=Nicotiana tabacum TaxID=4097 RepID=UPI003F4EDDE6
MTKFFCSLEITQKVEFTAVRSCSKRYELKCIVDKFGWNVRATRIKNFTLFRVIKCHNIHECSVDARKSDQKQATLNFISEQIIEHVRDKKIEVTPAFVENKMKKKFEIDIGYHKAWRAIQKAIACIRGTPEENYKIFPSYLHMMVCKNPGTYISIKRDAQNRFAYMFFAPVTSVAGWSYCRPVIAVDATFLKSKYHGVLFVAIETNQLQMGLEKFFLKLTMLMSQLKSIDKKTYNYIMEEPLERWARSWFPQRHYDMLTTNMVESMNSVSLKGRERPILRMLDFIQEKLGVWFYERRKKANETFHRVSIWAEEEMTKKMDLACKMFVFNLDSILFRINSEGIEFIVDLKKRTCDCLEFQLDELSCPDAIAAINKRYLQKSDYCSNWYSKEIWLKIYEGHVNTVGDQKSWNIPQNVQSEITKPPDVEILQGRRQKKRHIPVTESVPFKSTKCS